MVMGSRLETRSRRASFLGPSSEGMVLRQDGDQVVKDEISRRGEEKGDRRERERRAGCSRGLRSAPVTKSGLHWKRGENQPKMQELEVCRVRHSAEQPQSLTRVETETNEKKRWEVGGGMLDVGKGGEVRAKNEVSGRKPGIESSWQWTSSIALSSGMKRGSRRTRGESERRTGE